MHEIPARRYKTPLAVFAILFSIALVTHFSSTHPIQSLRRHAFPAPPSTTLDLNTQDDTDAQYRLLLNTVRPSDNVPHTSTLGVADAVYIISLPRRHDRRFTMTLLTRALDISPLFVNATDYRIPSGELLVNKLIRRVRWQRPRIDQRTALDNEIPEPDTASSDTHIHNAFPFAWSKDATENADDPLAVPLGVSGADYWDMDPADRIWEIEHMMPNLSEEEKSADIPTSSVTNSVFRNAPLTKAMVACWHSHIRALRDAVRNQHQVTIVFEDDIDIEWDAEKALTKMWSALPSDWDIVYLGHCWSQEHDGDPLPGSFRLRKTYHTLCTHAYAVSLRGATKILRYLRSPDLAYSRPIDHALKDLIQMHLVNSYSVYPPLVIQTKKDGSDIIEGVDAAWSLKEGLVDSTLERIQMLDTKMGSALGGGY